MEEEASEDERAPPPEGARPAAGCGRSREAVAEACHPCPERDGALRRELLCRCPVALVLRLLVRVERFGDDPGGLPSGERASLDYQERAFARRLPDFNRDALAVAARMSGTSAHPACGLPGCLRCRAARILDELAAVPA